MQAVWSGCVLRCPEVFWSLPSEIVPMGFCLIGQALIKWFKTWLHGFQQVSTYIYTRMVWIYKTQYRFYDISFDTKLIKYEKLLTEIGGFWESLGGKIKSRPQPCTSEGVFTVTGY